MCCSFFQKILSMRLPSSTFQFISSEELNYRDIWLTSLTLPFPHHTPPTHTHTLFGLSQTQNIGFWLSMSLVTSLVSRYPPQFLARQAPPWQLTSVPHKSFTTHQFRILLISFLPPNSATPWAYPQRGKKGSGVTAHGCIFYLPPSSSVPSHVTEEHNSLRLTKRWWSSVMRMLNYPWGADSSFLVQSEYLINMCVITRAAPTIALCTQNPYIHSVLIYMSDFSGTRAVCHGLCGMIGKHWTRRWNRLSGYVCLTIR